MALSDKIDKRELLPYHILVASIFAGLNEMGMLNQASVNVASRRAGKYLAEYTQTQGLLDAEALTAPHAEKVKRLIEKLDALIELGTRVTVSGTVDGAEIRIFSMGCKFCPKGVGEAELKGALCPYPGLIEEYVNAFLDDNDKVKLVSTHRRHLRKLDDNCVMVLR